MLSRGMFTQSAPGSTRCFGGVANGYQWSRPFNKSARSSAFRTFRRRASYASSKTYQGESCEAGLRLYATTYHRGTCSPPSPVSWERAGAKVRHDALYYLCKQTHFHSTALRFVPAADGVLAQLKCMLLHSRGDPLLIPFVDAHSYIILAQNAFVNTGTQKLGGSNGTLRQYTTLTAGGGFPSPAAAQSQRWCIASQP